MKPPQLKFDVTVEELHKKIFRIKARSLIDAQMKAIHYNLDESDCVYSSRLNYEIMDVKGAEAKS